MTDVENEKKGFDFTGFLVSWPTLTSVGTGLIVAKIIGGREGTLIGAVMVLVVVGIWMIANRSH
jgi:hypothetical protein